MRCLASVLIVLLLGTSETASGQARRAGVEVRGGAALGIASTSVAGRSSTDVGGVLTAQLGFVASTRADLTLDLAIQPFKARNPARGEAFTAVYSLLGVQVGLGALRRVYVRPELGVVVRSWSGSDVFVPSETSPAVGFALGGEVALSATLALAPELFVRLSGATELSTSLWGLAISVVPVGARSKPR